MTDSHNTASSISTRVEPLRILITALGGEGGGTLTNWLVTAARATNHHVQATSVPGVAQRTGATSYYLEVSAGDRPAVLNLLPMPGRVDIVLSSELLEAGRVIEQGYVSPENTTLIASHSRTYAIAEKIQLDDGRYNTAAIEQTAQQMARRCILIDLQKIAQQNKTFISTSLYGALAGSGVLPWSVADSRGVLESNSTASLAGFDAAVDAAKLAVTTDGSTFEAEEPSTATTADTNPLSDLMRLATQRLEEYQDSDYANLYQSRMKKLTDSIDTNGPNHSPVMIEAARRLANWMSYEDIARVADLKTQPQRYAEVRAECGATDDQLVRITEYLKPRAEEIADVLPIALGQRMLKRAKQGKRFPLLGKGRRIPSNAAWGYWLLRLVASLKRFRRKSLRYRDEQEQIDLWLDALCASCAHSENFALALAELPRVRKGYSDTLQRGLISYTTIFKDIVQPAIDNKQQAQTADALKEAINAAFRDEDHQHLNETVMKFHPPESLLKAQQASGGLANA